MSGKLLFAVSRRHSLGSLITRTVSPGARWGHCALVDTELGVVVEALLIHGVVATPLESWASTYSAHQFFDVPVPDPSAGLDFARKQLGKPYDYLGATSVPGRSSWQDDSKWYCSELCTAIVHAAGRRMCRDLQRGIHPHDFFRWSDQ